jgi:hypothetical protein
MTEATTVEVVETVGADDGDTTNLGTVKKDHLVLAMLAVMGGQERAINERDLFLASWHAFPNAMRWVDTALPNPDTYTAALRRLDAAGIIERLGKQIRDTRRRRKSVRRNELDAGRSGVVKARIREGGLEKAGITSDLLAEVRRMAPARESYSRLSAATLVVLCVDARRREGRVVDEGALVETAFHKFPARFAYAARPEFPDIEAIRVGIREASEAGLLDSRLALTARGKEEVASHEAGIDIRLDPSESFKSGAFRLADRIERTDGYKAYVEHGTLVATKPDELFRMLRVPPTTNPAPVATALATRMRELVRIDKGKVAAYLLEVASRHNSDVAALVPTDVADLLRPEEKSTREER